jgi:lipoprotein NlpI
LILFLTYLLDLAFLYLRQAFLFSQGLLDEAWFDDFVPVHVHLPDAVNYVGFYLVHPGFFDAWISVYLF